MSRAALASATFLAAACFACTVNHARAEAPATDDPRSEEPRDDEPQAVSPQPKDTVKAGGKKPESNRPVVDSERWPKRDIHIRLTLEEAVQIGLEKNLDIRISRVDHWKTSHDIVVEKATFDPIFNMGADYTKSLRPTASFLDLGDVGLLPVVQANPTDFGDVFIGMRGITPIGTNYTLRLGDSSFNRPAAGGLFGINPQISASASVQVVQPLLKGAWYPYNNARIAIARNNQRFSYKQFELAATETIFAIEQAYWELAFSLKNYESRNKALDVASQDLGNAKKRNEVGSLAAIDVTIIASQVALRKVEFRDAELLLENARDVLLDLLNHSGDRTLKQRWKKGDGSSPYDRILIIPTTRADSGIYEPDRDDAIDLAFENRPDFHQLNFELKSQNIRVDLAKNEMLPQLDFTAGWEQFGLAETYGDSASSITSGEFYAWAVGFRLEVPILQRGPRSKLLRARDEVLKINLRRAKLENQIILQIDQNLRDLHTIYAKVVDLDERVRLQGNILEAERKKVLVGRSIDYIVSTIENDLIDSQAQALRAKADYQISKATHYRVTGTLLKKYGILLREEGL